MAGNQKKIGRVQQSLWFTPEEKRKLGDLAQNMRVSKSQVIRIALEKILIELEQTDTIAIPKEQRFGRQTDNYESFEEMVV